MGVARENEGFDAERTVGVQFFQHLGWVPDDGGAGAGAADAGPEVFFGKAFVGGGFAVFGLAADADAGVIERAFADRLARVGIEAREQAADARRHRLGPKVSRALMGHGHLLGGKSGLAAGRATKCVGVKSLQAARIRDCLWLSPSHCPLSAYVHLPKHQG